MIQTIISWQWIVWILISIVANVFFLASLLTSSWLSRTEVVETRNLVCPQIDDSLGPLALLPPRAGPLFRCHPVCDSQDVSSGELCRSYVFEQLRGGHVYSEGSRATVILLLCAVFMLILADIGASISPIFRDLKGYSIFSLVGILQCITDVCLLAALVIWPTGWGSSSVREVCGGAALLYDKGSCQIGWGLYGCVVSIILFFFSAVLSNFVDKSIIEANVQRRMLQGETFLFV